MSAPVHTTTVAAPAPPPSRRRGYDVAFWGMVTVIITEGMIFLGLLSSYFFLRASSDDWPLGGIEKPPLFPIWIFTIVLLASSIPVVWAEMGIRRGDQRRLRIGLALAFVMGLAFLGHQAYEYDKLTYGWGDNAYGSIFYVTTGLHALHVLVGLAISLVVQAKAWSGKLSEDRHVSMEVFGLYWHFVDAVWIFVFGSLYLSEYVQ